MFTGKAAAAPRRKNESATERIVLGIERRGGFNAEREVERVRGTVDGFEGGDVFILWTEIDTAAQCRMLGWHDGRGKKGGMEWSLRRVSCMVDGR